MTKRFIKGVLAHSRSPAPVPIGHFFADCGGQAQRLEFDSRPLGKGDDCTHELRLNPANELKKTVLSFFRFVMFKQDVVRDEISPSNDVLTSSL